ncbi:MAG: hypothetical protein M0P71_13085 [Melioribacteraceae bacterium]|jgi:hypothetical protein|nr:hypothetical protein [Melioribacteraceae bacterium]
MTAEEGRAACGIFGCIRGREDSKQKCRYPIKMYGTVVVTDSYNLLFNNTSDELVFFRLRYVESFYAWPEGKKLIKIPHRYKKFVNLHHENQRGMAHVFYGSEYSGLSYLSLITILLAKLI